MKKVIIIGCPGSGKSTFARAFSEKMGLPLHYLDMMYWNADKSTVPREVFRARLREVMAQDEWIIDGNYGSTMEMRMAACDTVIFLDYPTEVCLDGILGRRGKPRPDMPWVEDGEDAEFLSFVSDFRHTERVKILERLSRYSDKNIIILQDRAEADRFLLSLRHAE